MTPGADVMSLKAVLFDMDGTVVNVPYDWPLIKRDLATGGEPILSHLQKLPEPECGRKWKILENYEEEATSRASLKEGIAALLLYLKEKAVLTALVTNNSRKNVDFLLGRFQLRFDLILSRESGLWKPSGAPFKSVMLMWALSPHECCAVGDSLFDVRAAEEAEIFKILIVNEDPLPFLETEAEVFPSIPDLHRRLQALLESNPSG